MPTVLATNYKVFPIWLVIGHFANADQPVRLITGSEVGAAGADHSARPRTGHGPGAGGPSQS